MWRKWSVILPVLGLICFAIGTEISVRRYREMNPTHSSRYFYWSSIRLDSDPHNKRPFAHRSVPCHDGTDNCLEWDPEHIWIDPGFAARAFMLCALPAFAIGTAIVAGMSRFGVSQIASFMTTMPCLVVAWFYFLGWVIDRWRSKRFPSPASSSS